MPRAADGIARGQAPHSEPPTETTPVHEALTPHYSPIRRISQGPTASVWLARDDARDTTVVLKQLEPAFVRDRVARTRLEAEAQVSDAISHPSIVPVIDRIDSADTFALVSPYIPGRTLRQRLEVDGNLPPRDAASIAVEVADVLATTHAAGIVHRDVKPANILLGDDGRVRLLDFGIARDVSGNGGAEVPDRELTGSGMAIGTLPYMAPEQLTGGPPSSAADVYALGVVMYEMLSGRRPYDARSPSEQLRAQQDVPPSIPGAPQPIATLCIAALDSRPEQRPTAAAFGRTLRAWLDAAPDWEAATAAVAVVGAPGAAAAREPAPLAQPEARRFGGIAIPPLDSRRLVAGALIALFAVTALVFAITAMPASISAPRSEPEAAPIDVPATAAPQPVNQPAREVVGGADGQDANENGGEGNGRDDDLEEPEENKRDENKPEENKPEENKPDDKPGEDKPDEAGGDDGRGNGDERGGNGTEGGGNGTEGHLPEGRH